MQHESQTSTPTPSAPRVVVVAGPAGSGKSTLGTALARILGVAPLDLDSVTNPLLDTIGPRVLRAHWLQGEHASAIRAGRYAALLTTAADIVAVGQGAVLIAPFSQELDGGAAWAAMLDALRPATVHVLHLHADPALLARRRGLRAEARDEHRPDVPLRTPIVPHIRIDALLAPEQQLVRALQAVGHRTPLDVSSPVFGRAFEAALFDLDGTLADSTAAVLRSWAKLADEYGFDTAAVHENHGRPARALLDRLMSPERAAAAAARVEVHETADVEDIRPTPGALDLLAALDPGRTAIVTSGKRPVAGARIAAAGITPPPVVVTRDDVVNGKPDPEPFLLAAARLGVDPAACVAFEDATAGILAARSAGCTVIAVRGTVSDDALSAADLVVDSLDRIAVQRTGSSFSFRAAP